ncbi:ATP-dependent zinc metalloprotease FtsH [Acidithiobacillus ferrivorans]|nr:ATP-dependent zinc metalloprotease FtsH [Acidithiobacillus ferrivorans]
MFNKKNKSAHGGSILRRLSETLRLHFKSIFTVLLIIFVVWMAIGAGKLSGLMEAHKIAPNATISYAGFIAAVTANHHLHSGKVFIENDGMAIFHGSINKLDKKWEITNFSSNVNKSGLSLLAAHHVPIKGSIAIGLTPYRPVAQAAVAAIFRILGSMAVLVVYAGFAFYMYLNMRQYFSGGLFTKKFKIWTPSDTNAPAVSFDQVAGLEGPKHEVSEVVDYLKNPQRFARHGAHMPSGILLFGPPGNGKTMLAKAVAGEAGVAFIEQDASSFVHLFVGAGAGAVRDLFKMARSKAPCVVFIDEIDAVGGSRSAGGGHDERLQTLNALLSEMDGFEGREGVIVIAATNRLESLDPALLRPGRFDRHVFIPQPGANAREHILQTYLKRLPRPADVEVHELAMQSQGFSGADIARWVNESAMEAARGDAPCITSSHFSAARDRILVGARNYGVHLDETERRAIAYHESGHAVVNMARGGKVDKVSILPRGQTLGVTVSRPDERTLHSREEWERNIDLLLGGRAAEELFVGSISSGASNDLERASQMAFEGFAKLGYGTHLHVPQSPEMAAKVEQEAATWLDKRYLIVKDLLLEHTEEMHTLANSLIQQEEVDFPSVIPHQLPSETLPSQEPARALV